MSDYKLNDPLGVLETSDIPLKSQRQPDLGEWAIIMPGEETRRPKELRRVAYTRAELTFDTEENLSRFLEILKESDERLSRIPDSEVLYDWQKVTRKGLTVRFGVAWYDLEFFKQRKDAHESSLHRGIFAKFGATPDSLRIEHILL